jgi:hypothetical protein
LVIVVAVVPVIVRFALPVIVTVFTASDTNDVIVCV